MAFGFRLSFLWVALATMVSIAHSWAQEDAPPESLVLQNAAANLQNDGKFEMAVEQWAELIKQYPNTKSTHEWRYHLGVCEEKLGNHAAAAMAFEATVQSAPKDYANLAQGWLHLGYNLWKQSKSIADQNEGESKQLSARAVESFQTLLKEFPKSDVADQASYFLGEAKISAGDLEGAIAAFDKLILEQPDSKFWPDAVFALGSCHEEKADFAKALTNYDRFLEKAPQAKQANEVRFRKAETLLKLALAAEKSGDKSAAEPHFAAAEKIYDALGKDAEFVDRETAAYQKAVVQARIAQPGEAAKAFAEFHKEFPNSSSAINALIAAGQNFLKANDLKSAEAQLRAALDIDPKSIAAAHWLCRTHLAADQPQKAWDLAETTLGQVGADDPAIVSLLLDRADAAYAIPAKVADSEKLYLAVVEKFPKHALAPQALYNAAFSALLAKNPDRAIELAKQFTDNYPGDSFAADVKEVHAEAAVQKQQWDVAEQIYRQLTSEFPNHKKLADWQVGLTQTLALAGKNKELLDWAEPLIEKLEGRRQADMLFHLGTAQFQAQQFDKALENLNRALQQDGQWPRRDEATLLAARAEFRAGQVDAAIARARKFLTDFQNSSLRDQALYRLGEFSFESEKFEDAQKSYSQVIEQFPESSYVPAALYGRGWAELRLKNSEKAIESFDVLIERFPQHTLVADAALARGMARRRGGEFGEAAADLDRFLASNPRPAEKAEALYERGLIDVDQKDFDAVLTKFGELLKLAEAEKLLEKWGDKCHYELAWAYKSKDNPDKAIEHFTAIVEKFPQSSLAAEARFHLGETAYESGQFDNAVTHYTAAVQQAKNDIELAEKAAYKLAWSYYKKQDYPTAEKSFRAQVKEYPQGALKADGLFMVSESLFRQKQHGEAVTAYKAALPEVQASPNVREDVKMLTLLHGAQSANETKQFDEAVRFLKPLVDSSSPPASYAAEAWFEYGQALKGLGQIAEAIEAWRKAQLSFDKTGIRARCMIAEAMFEEKKFDDAIKEFTLAVYGYGGREANETIRPWQAFAAYELARCNLVQVNSAGADQRPKLIAEAKNWFNYLIEHYPEDRLTAEAKNQIAKLNNM